MEDTEGMEPAEEAAPAAAEFVAEKTHKPKSDVYTVLLLLAFLAFLGGSIVAGRQAWEHYDVQFWMFTKHPKGSGTAAPAESAPTTETPAAPAAAPASNP